MITNLAASGTLSEKIKEFNKIRQYTEEQCKPLIIEDYIPQPVAYISPPKWHLGHTTWFFEEFVLSKFSMRILAFYLIATTIQLEKEFYVLIVVT